MNVRAYTFFSSHIFKHTLLLIMMSFLKNMGILKRDILQNFCSTKDEHIYETWWRCLIYVLNKCNRNINMQIKRFYIYKRLYDECLFYDLEICRINNINTVLAAFLYLDCGKNYIIIFDILNLTIILVNYKSMHYINLSNMRVGCYKCYGYYSAIANLVVHKRNNDIFYETQFITFFKQFGPLYEKICNIQ